MATVEVALHKEASEITRKLRKERLATWASMGCSRDTAQNAESDTQSEAEYSCDDSDTQGLPVMNALLQREVPVTIPLASEDQLKVEPRSPTSPCTHCSTDFCTNPSSLRSEPRSPQSPWGSLPPEFGSSPSVLQQVKLKEVEESIQRLSGYVLKYPIDGGKWFAQAKERYFSVVVPVSWHPEGDNLLRSCSAQLDEPSLCYWVDEELSMQKEPLGALPISAITEVSRDANEDQGLLVKIEASSLCRYCQLSKATDVKGGIFVLTMKFADATEAESWTSDLKKFIHWFQTKGA